ncbi:MAG: bifunctional UDP-3-O-[3-hydroxymyristoyl] N-acetylglucosamine deacetylase/3-hydroxyacyl-ACP dehydratase [Candidatus Delongbacteria bacterium]|nr:bifunctional UDP-3-O-[3-hydroxymyristoyl] N-acetylglucosamine deacetylase/3-hydroxyacyl-ACP dehydratase [Candidatus Delongbacteria bacterium]MBN2834676.1 bifunctional UDP-3-O-[3-hydroxymyristoyl] N-acetylglucosamine deacetylase/3-hydroxyacyl-ACP dehydratase [Candidatus Delongbacteria bacterium]
MFIKQRTIAEQVSVSGIGLHTGCQSTITFKPAKDDTGVIFRRIDLETPVDIPALIDYVDSIARGTILSNEGVKVYTVEHVLAALAGLQIDNVIIEIDAEEPPVLDGSAIGFVNVLINNVVEQEKPKEYFEIEKNVEYKELEKGIELIAVPSTKLQITYMVDYRNPALGTQFTTLYDLEKEFVDEYASTRTFCFLSEVEKLKEVGLIKGGNLDNSVVILDRELSQEERNIIESKLDLPKGVLPETKGIVGSVVLRYPNEPVRHKLLDLLGDLMLLGTPVKGHFLCARGGHEAHIGLVKELKKAIDKHKLIKKYKKSDNENFVFDVKDIMSILPHRFPMLLVDRILELVPEERVVGLKNVTANEDFFNGHYPGKPVMPGVLIVEAMAQTGGILLMNTLSDKNSKVPFFTSIDKVKFRRPVVPGDQIIMEIDMVRPLRRGICQMQGTAYVDGKKAAEALMTAMLVDKTNEE